VRNGWLAGMTEAHSDQDNAGASLGRLANLEVVIADSERDVARAQRLRYQIFYEELSAVADAETEANRRDDDVFDAVCDHLLILDHDRLGEHGPEIVATTRLLRQDVAVAGPGFYSASEFDIDRMVDRNPQRRFLELGRTCVTQPYRGKRTVELMWHGLWRYVRQHELDVMVGCGSLEGTDTKELAPVLALLGDVAPAPAQWRIKASAGKGIPLSGVDAGSLSRKEALRALPPLIKGYLRLGAFVGQDAFVDHQFGTTDIFLILPLEAIRERYIRFYGAEADRYAA